MRHFGSTHNPKFSGRYLKANIEELLVLLGENCNILGLKILGFYGTVKPVLSSHSKEDKKKKIFKTGNCIMQVKSIAECSKGSILQYL